MGLTTDPLRSKVVTYFSNLKGIIRSNTWSCARARAEGHILIRLHLYLYSKCFIKVSFSELKQLQFQRWAKLIASNWGKPMHYSAGQTRWEVDVAQPKYRLICPKVYFLQQNQLIKAYGLWLGIIWLSFLSIAGKGIFGYSDICLQWHFSLLPRVSL